MQQKEEKPTQVWAKNTESNTKEAQAGVSEKEKAVADEQLTKPTASPPPSEQDAEEKRGSPPKPVKEEACGSGETPPEPADQIFRSDREKTGADRQPTTDCEDQPDCDSVGGAAPPPYHPRTEDGKIEEDPGVTTKASNRPEEYPKPAGVLKWKKGDSGEDVKTEPGPVRESAKEKISSGEPGSPLDHQEEEEAPEKGERKKLTKKVLLFTFVWFPLLLVAALAGGLLIGYSVIGDDPAGDVFTRDLWEHLYNLIYG
ncbi:hypothetical protein GCM10007416_18500 [Kroppenstedtia guangzhouensis]|jgi:DNA-directed RNA polymerase subunit beta|uniref:DNA-directed RNA polymerase subunit beta n=1 Tax=Kroppenstedtia guangzhouensis TaxID=1274356 RepID=A0ABQ1GKX3_9BACL|nr:DNA-directed RNA polymerase subunit beta [Kroppenstedtia guangzhouensis]GGA45651.1 hypothetical protein GCM10007416_18500 [Kroppenstedtia guangzhouensis]